MIGPTTVLHLESEMKALLYILLLLAFNCVAFAQENPREQLKQYVADLQKSPDDQALREKIIKLALTLDPKPAIPEDAERFMARGAAAIKDAKVESDFKDAAQEFEKATLAAPWLANAYYNLGVAQSKAGDYGGAARSLKLYLLAAPDAPDVKEAKSLMYEMEDKKGKIGKAKDAAAEAAERERQKNGGLHELRDLVKGKQYYLFTVVGRWKE